MKDKYLYYHNFNGKIKEMETSDFTTAHNHTFYSGMKNFYNLTNGDWIPISYRLIENEEDYSQMEND